MSLGAQLSRLGRIMHGIAMSRQAPHGAPPTVRTDGHAPGNHRRSTDANPLAAEVGRSLVTYQDLRER